MIPFKMFVSVCVAGALLVGGQIASAAEPAKSPPSAIPTFHCLGIYWSPQGGQAEKKVLMKFRRAGEQAWHEALPMRYNPVDTPECKADYRGSIVNLTPGASYEVDLTLEGTSEHTSLKAGTWSETFPIASTVKCQSAATTLKVNKSGTASGYVLYDGTGCTIDTANKQDLGISVDANYVILRGFTIKNVKSHGIRINAGHHVVIENCDVSKWGSEDGDTGFGIEQQACVFSKDKNLHAVVIQRCKFHNPNWGSNSWAVDHFKTKKSRHPDGPQTIVFFEPQGNNVIRYNECWSDKDHYYNDVIGGAFNGSYRGFPGADSDIYCNYFANCWDDGIESEGGNQNVRIWNNYIENTMMMIANAATSIGPFYVWRNVTGRSYTPPGSSYDLTHGYFMKMGYADGDKWMTGHMYVFNNTIFQPNDDGADGLGGDSKPIKHCVTRNNIFQSRPKDTRSISTDTKRSDDNDYDYDLLSAKYPKDTEKHGVKGIPQYVPNAGFNFDTKTVNVEQAPGSPGIDKGEVIPNFADSFTGAAPDMGAEETGAAPLVVGVKANFSPQK